MNGVKLLNVFVCVILCTSGKANADPKAKTKKELPNDTAYIEDYSNQLTVRLYGSRKFTGYILGERDKKINLKYRPNDNFNTGIGFTYKYVGINLGFKVPFLNDDNKKYGKTRFLDLQSYVYSRKITVDFYAQFYNGYYISNRNIIDNKKDYGNTFPQRPDIKTRNVGINAQYILNNRRFSYRASYLQNEYQKKSSGTVLVGGGLHFINAHGDSAIIPPNVIYSDFFNNSKFNKTNIYCLAVNGGYAYTLVVKKHYFATASISVGAGLNYTKMEDSKAGLIDEAFGPQLNGILRFSTGYNSPRYFAGVTFVNFITRNDSPMPGAWQEFQAGNVRFYVAKRFKLKKKVQKMIPLPDLK